MMRELIDRVEWASRRMVARTSHIWANSQIRAGRSPRVGAEQQLDMLRRYYDQLRHLEPVPPGRSSPIRFTVVILDAGTGAADMREAIGSVLFQTHPHWQLTGRSVSGAGVDRVLHRFAELWPTRWHDLAGPGGAPEPSERSGWVPLSPYLAQIAAGVPGYLVLLDSRDRLLPNALSEFARAIRRHQQLQDKLPGVLYGDELLLEGDRQRRLHKPGWSPLLQLTTNYAAGPVALRADALLAAGGPRGATRMQILHDYLLRAGEVEPPVLVPHLLQRRTSVGPLARPAVAAAYLDRVGVSAEVRSASPATVALDFGQPDPAPLVSIVILNRDAPDLVHDCVASVLAGSFQRLEVVIVDNGSQDPRTLAHYRTWSSDPRVQVVRSADPFNYAALCNLGVAASRGDFVILLNNDTEVLTRDWIEQMLGLARLPGVGVVGAQLRYPDGRVQHMGVSGLAEHGPGHMFVGRRPADDTPFDLLRAPHEVLAVTGACLLIARDLYQELGGLSEDFLPNDSGDIDLCLRAGELGRRTVIQPAAVLLHHESATRRRSVENFARFALLQKWPGLMLNDPYLNPNLEKSTRYLADPDLPQPVVPVAMLDTWCRAGRVAGHPVR